MGFEILSYHNLVTIVAWSNEQMDRFRQAIERSGEITGPPSSALFVFHPIAPKLKFWPRQNLAKAGGRSSRIRTCDPRLPKTVLYQTELYSDIMKRFL